MRRTCASSLRALVIILFPLPLFVPWAVAGTVTIYTPSAGTTVAGAVTIAAAANESTSFHLEVWDNGSKLGDFSSNSVNTAVSMSQGSHTTTVLAVSNAGQVLSQSSTTYNVLAPSGVSITSPAAGSTSISAVTISASANASTLFHLEIWDNGYKLGNVFANNVNGVYVLPNGSHVLTVQAIDNNGSVIGNSSVNYNVAENCSNSASTQCNLDQIADNNVQNDCNPLPQIAWVANGCGAGIQGANPVFPQNTFVASFSEGGTIPDQGNLTLNGSSLHLGETQGSNGSNVLFRGQSPALTGTTIDSHWTMDEYVYLPNPNAHQALELDAQYTGGNIWTKFYTECAFNMNDGTGFWAVFDTSTGGWIFLNGQSQGGQTPPVVPCNRSQFFQPWSGSSNPSFTGWHHIVWTFLRDSDGTVTFQTLTFDGTTTQVNFKPLSLSGGSVSDEGNFFALIQLNGVDNPPGQFNLVDAYVNELNLTHTP
jgi:hypothetical protein